MTPPCKVLFTPSHIDEGRGCLTLISWFPKASKANVWVRMVGLAVDLQVVISY